MKKIIFIGYCIAYLLLSYSCYAQSSFSLRQAIRQAAQNHPLLKVAQYNVPVFQSDITTAGLRYNPQINSQLLILFNRNNFADNSSFLVSGRNRQDWWQLTQQLYVKQQRQKKIDFAKENVNLVQKNIEEIKRNLVFEVANLWLDTWILKERLVILRETKTNVDTLIRINENRLKNEVILPSELIRTQILSEQFQLQIIDTERQLSTQKNSLTFLLGASDSVTVSDIDIDYQNVPLQLDSLFGYATQRRTDIQVNQQAIRTAEANLKLQEALKYPQPEVGILVNPQNGVFYAGTYFNIPIPLFDKNQGEIQKAKILKQQAEFQLNTNQLQAKTEISNAYHLYQTAKANLVKYADIVDKSRQVLNTVRYAYLKGNTTIIDYLDAQRTFFSTQQFYNEALQDVQKKYINLLYVSGLIQQLVE
ncbi:MAG: TolC family protein [Thermoflexibacter sp.]|jgi:cobalt-zinc-cadmium efflux system outer membrane protein|nr:TolC family protein [Thermoflexibacter sp.]